MTDTTDLLQDAGPATEPPAAPAQGAPAAAPRTRRRATSGSATTGSAQASSAGSGSAGSGSLSAMVLPALQALAGDLGIGSTGRMRKSQLIEAIQAKQGMASGAVPPAVAAPSVVPPAAAASAVTARANGRRAAPIRADREPVAETAPVAEPVRADEVGRTDTAPPADEPRADGGADTTDEDRPERVDRGRERFLEREARRQERLAQQAEGGDVAPATGVPVADRAERQPQNRDAQNRDAQNRDAQNRDAQNRDAQNRDLAPTRQPQRDTQNRDTQNRDTQNRDTQNRDTVNRDTQNRDTVNRDTQNRDTVNRDTQDSDGTGPRRDEDDDATGRRGRFRERGRNRRSGRGADRYAGSDNEPVVSDDDVLVPIGGILDILDNYGFVRTSGYLTGPNDVYVSLQQVRKYGLRRGDAVTGAVRQQREGERKDKYNALVRLDSVNGLDVEEARKRPEFTKLTPLYPQDRLRLETEPGVLTTRVIDLVMPVGKGQRALIVSPPKAGKNMVMQAIANAISVNNPEVHLMVVLVDERPEEVTDMQRSVKGEVIASTFDRPPQDHITVAELSIERAKRLVELGHDVVVLLDSITRLGRAYNLGAPASGRILTGGVDSAALYPPKRFLGAARNVENGGSLTIFATALVETGSAMDTVIFEEFKGTGNAELKLDRRLADKRIFPAIDVDASGTRKEEILLAPEELRIVLQLRRVLHALDTTASLELLLDKMKKTRTNVEFLMQIQKTTVTND